MPEGYFYNPNQENNLPVDSIGSGEIQKTDYKYVEHVPDSFANNPDVFKLKHLLEMDAENTIVVVGDEILYLGGTLNYENVPHLDVPVPDYFNPEVKKPGPVRAIKEDGRIIVFATNHEKAMLYINQNRKDVVVA